MLAVCSLTVALQIFVSLAFFRFSIAVAVLLRTSCPAEPEPQSAAAVLTARLFSAFIAF